MSEIKYIPITMDDASQAWDLMHQLGFIFSAIPPGSKIISTKRAQAEGRPEGHPCFVIEYEPPAGD